MQRLLKNLLSMLFFLIQSGDKSRLLGCCTKNFSRLKVDVRESSVLSGPNYLELSALEGNRRYDIWVKAETSAGYGPSSDITSIILGHTGKKNGAASQDKWCTKIERTRQNPYAINNPWTKLLTPIFPRGVKKHFLHRKPSSYSKEKQYEKH